MSLAHCSVTKPKGYDRAKYGLSLFVPDCQHSGAQIHAFRTYHRVQRDALDRREKRKEGVSKDRARFPTRS